MKKGEIVVEFDTTEQEYKLKEAEADVAEAEQHLIQAEAQNEAQAEEDRYALLKAQTDVQLAELDVRKNPLLPPLTARENTLALDAAKDHLAQLERNLANRKATSDGSDRDSGSGESQSGVAGKDGARKHRSYDAEGAARRIRFGESEHFGGTFCFSEWCCRFSRSGDTVRPGMAVAEIPDLDELGIVR